MHFHVPTLAAALASAVVAIPAASHAQTAKPERVAFARGTSSKVIKGAIRGDQSRIFLIGVRAGQTMRIKLVSSNASANFNITAPGAQQALFIGSTSGNEYNDVIPSTGDYQIDLFLMRNAARRNETTTFMITLSVVGQ